MIETRIRCSGLLYCLWVDMLVGSFLENEGRMKSNG